MALSEDLQRCRRMVASMRGLVMASSLRLQLLGEFQTALVERENRIANQRNQLDANKKDSVLRSPRTCYKHQFRTQRIRVIQRQWRKYRLQRLLVEKMMMERKWRANRGNTRMVKAVTAIQCVFRGFSVRRKLRESTTATAATPAATHPSLLVTILQTQQQTRLERLQADRIQFHKLLTSRLTEFHQKTRDLVAIRTEKLTTEQTIASQTTRKGKTGAVLIDSKLLDGTVVRMEAHQLLLHQTSEIERLVSAITDLEASIATLQDADPVVHRAASQIQYQFRKHTAYKRHQLKLHRQRTARIRLRLSSDRCLDRMNVGFLQRQQLQWHQCAKIIQGLYSIIVAKRLLHVYRQRRAVKLIERVYIHKRDRVHAHARIAWQRTKLRVELFALRRLRRRTAHCWRDWRSVALFEKKRRTRIEEVCANGHTKWITSKALILQRLFRSAMKLRHTRTEQIVPVLHPVLRQILETVASQTAIIEPRDLFLQFYQQITQHIHAWRVPSTHLYSLAHRYEMPLDVLPLDEIWEWLLHQQQDTSLDDDVKVPTQASSWFLDVRVPYPVRSLRFLASLSRYFELYDRISFQQGQVWLHSEARQCVRAYLALLFAHNAVAFTNATTFSHQQRKLAVQQLQSRITEDTPPLDHSAPGLGLFHAEGNAFTTFHSVWTDLCEQCLALESDRRVTRECTSCGHRHIERSTAAKPSHAAVAQHASPLVTSDKPAQYVHHTERCDFLVIHAFFHALAPRGHAHRELYAPEALWKIALAKAYEPVTILYEQYGIHTLEELIQYREIHCRRGGGGGGGGLQEWESFLPVQVIDKLELFLHIFKDELVKGV